VADFCLVGIEFLTRLVAHARGQEDVERLQKKISDWYEMILYIYYNDYKHGHDKQILFTIGSKLNHD